MSGDRTLTAPGAFTRHDFLAIVTVGKTPFRISHITDGSTVHLVALSRWERIVWRVRQWFG